VKRLSHNSALWVTIAVMGSFWMFYLILTPEQLVEFASSLVLGASVSIVLTWFPAAAFALRNGAKDGPGLLNMGIFGLAGAILAQRIWINILRWFERPDWLVNSPVSAFTAWILFCACMLVILAPGTERGVVPNRNYLWLLAAASIGSLVAGITIGIFLVR